MKKTVSIPHKQMMFALIIITVVVYIKSVFNNYALDDELYALSPVLEKPEWSQFFKNFTVRTFLDKNTGAYEYRPMAINSFLLEYLVFGKHVRLSHLINLLLYVLVLVQFYKLLIKFQFGSVIAFAIILSFALHPVHTEVVCNLKCRDELLAFAFMLGAFNFAVNYLNTGRTWQLVPVCVFFFLALLSKQSVMVFFVSIPLSILFFIRFDVKKVLLIFLALLSVFVAYMLIKKFGLPSEARKYIFHENQVAVNGFGDSNRFYTSLYLANRYLKLLVIPYPLAYYYGYKYVDVSSVEIFQVITALIVHAGLVVILFTQYKKNKQLAFGIFFYLIHLLPIVFFVKMMPGLLGERFLFAASFGFCIVVAIAFQLLYQKLKLNFKFNPLLIIVIIAYGAMSFQRTKAWKDKETLYKTDMATLEKSAKANLLYGALLSEQALKEKNGAKLEIAIKHLQRTTAIIPGYSLAWENLGVLYYFKGDYRQALTTLDIALQKDMRNSKAYFDKGIVYKVSGDFDKAEANFIKSLSYDPGYVPTYQKLMDIYIQRGQIEKSYAIGVFGTQYEKKTDILYTELSRIALLQSDTLRAVDFAEKAIKINPANTKRIETLMNYFIAKNNPEKAGYYKSLLAGQ